MFRLSRPAMLLMKRAMSTGSAAAGAESECVRISKLSSGSLIPVGVLAAGATASAIGASYGFVNSAESRLESHLIGQETRMTSFIQASEDRQVVALHASEGRQLQALQASEGRLVAALDHLGAELRKK